ncbi:MAG: hypothetical protein H6610_07295 [Ignavibacteriales bacterium]|nr:hypothetical protein [Ignavibacteriales bacterium]
MELIKGFISVRNILNFVIIIFCLLPKLNAQDWIWIDGSNKINGEANYAETFPGARDSSVTWRDNNGNYWLFGGRNGNDYYNDTWKYDISQDEWIFIDGSNQPNQSLDFPLTYRITSLCHMAGKNGN